MRKKDIKTLYDNVLVRKYGIKNYSMDKTLDKVQLNKILLAFRVPISDIFS